MTHEDKIIEELATKYGKSYTIKSKPYDYIHEGLNNTEFLSHFKSDLKKALTTYRSQVLGEKKMELEEEIERGGWSANQIETLRDLFDEHPTN